MKRINIAKQKTIKQVLRSFAGFFTKKHIESMLPKGIKTSVNIDPKAHDAWEVLFEFDGLEDGIDSSAAKKLESLSESVVKKMLRDNEWDPTRVEALVEGPTLSVWLQAESTGFGASKAGVKTALSDLMALVEYHWAKKSGKVLDGVEGIEWESEVNPRGVDEVVMSINYDTEDPDKGKIQKYVKSMWNKVGPDLLKSIKSVLSKEPWKFKGIKQFKNDSGFSFLIQAHMFRPVGGREAAKGDAQDLLKKVVKDLQGPEFRMTPKGSHGEIALIIKGQLSIKITFHYKPAGKEIQYRISRWADAGGTYAKFFKDRYGIEFKSAGFSQYPIPLEKGSAGYTEYLFDPIVGK